MIDAFSTLPGQHNFSTFAKWSLIAVDLLATWVKPSVWMEARAVWIGNARWRVQTTATTPHQIHCAGMSRIAVQHKPVA